MISDFLKDLGEFGVGAAAGMGIYLGALRARLNVLRDEVRGVREDVRFCKRRIAMMRRRLRQLPCQQVECREKQPPDADRVRGGDQ